MGRPFQQEITQPTATMHFSLPTGDVHALRFSTVSTMLPFLPHPSFQSHWATKGKPHAGIHQTLLEHRNRFYFLQETLLFLHGLPPTMLLPASCLYHALLALSICCFVTVYIFVSHIYRCTTSRCKQITYGFPGSAFPPLSLAVIVLCSGWKERKLISWTWNAQNKGIKWLCG